MREVDFQRKPVMAGNWKMFKTSAETRQFFKVFNTLVARVDHCEIVIAAPFVSLVVAVEETAGSPVRIAAQNMHWEAQGAFTGEISGPMVHAVGCNYVIVGHSERRQYFGETDETVRKRTAAALEHGLTPIVCVGERLEERETGMTEDVLTQQLTGALRSLTVEQFSRIIVAYEPVWAIGTGRTATPAIAAEAHEVLRIQAAKQFGEDSAAGLRILYGGSVKPDNVSGLMAESGVDGALVGGASLDPQSMALIVNYSGESF
jgi:triosephosphate isomerase